MNSCVGKEGDVIFTTSQWVELENQTLAFRYILSGIPIPSHLISNLFIPNSTTTNPSSFYPHHLNSLPTVGWGCFQVGHGRKIDTEPERCRRTDGKKWRCSKETNPNSKYCQKHINRGKSKSKNQKQLQSLNPITTIPPTPPISASCITEKCTSSLPRQYQPSSLSQNSCYSTMDAQNQAWVTDTELYDPEPNKTISFEF